MKVYKNVQDMDKYDGIWLKNYSIARVMNIIIGMYMYCSISR